MHSTQSTPVMPHYLSSILRKCFLLPLLSLVTIAPTEAAVTSLSSGTLTINFDATNEAITLSNNGTNITLSSNSAITGAGNSFLTSAVTKIVVTDTDNLAGQSLLLNSSNTTTFVLSGGFSCTGVETVTFNNSVTATGSASIVVTAPQKIIVSGSNVTLTGGSGGTQLTAQGTVPGNSTGIDINNGAVVTASGTGQVSVKGTGGVSTSDNNWGVLVEGTNSKITSSGGPVQVNGTGGGTGVSQFNIGVYLLDGGQILAGGTGTVTVEGQGGNADGITNVGVYVSDGKITSSGGGVSIKGTGGGTGASAFNLGVFVSENGEISAGGTGKVTVEGYGGKTSGNLNHGVYVVRNSGSLGKITSSGGDVSVKGFGGGKDGSTSNRGVYVWSGGSIVATGTGSVLVEGQGGNTTGESNQGVRVDNDTPSTGVGSLIGSSGGNVVVKGTGSGSSVSFNNYGVYVVKSAKISAGGSGTVTVEGQGATGANGDANYGVHVLFAEITSSGGNVSVKGTGGGSGSSKNNYGVHLLTSGKINAGGTGLVKVEGFGGTAPTGNTNHGVYLNESGTNITSSGGAVTVNGTGGGSGVSENNVGVYVQTNAQITAGSTATVTVVGNGGSSNGKSNTGVYVTGAKITSAGGNVSVTGTGKGGSNASFCFGVHLFNGGQITSGGSGIVNVEGYGADAASSFNYGVYVEGANAKVTSLGGNVIVKGTGGTNQSFAYGVYAYDGGEITAGGSGSVSVEGQGGNDPSKVYGNNYGVYLQKANSRITSSGGNVLVKGTGGEGNSFNYGVYVRDAGEITAAGSGSVNVEGKGGGGATDGNYNYGIHLENAGSQITSLNGNVTVNGTGGGLGTYNYGVYLYQGGKISAGGSGVVNVQGQGSNVTKGNYNFGVYLNNPASLITSSGGNVTVKGTGGAAGQEQHSNYGVNLFDGGKITASGNGTINVEGQGGNSTGGNYNYGVVVSYGNAQIISSGGNVTVKGTGGTGKINNHGVYLYNSSEITAGGNGTVNVEGQAGNATGEANFGVNLDSRITSANGSITVKGTGSNEAADIMINSSGLISSTSNTADISLNSLTNGTWPNASAIDVSTTSTRKLAFVAGSKLNINIIGTIVNVQYQQLNVVGMVDLNGTSLTFAESTYSPSLNNTFTIVNNDGTDAIIGTFSGLPEGSAITNFLGSGLDAKITYVGGDGNDVVLTVSCPSYTASSNSPVCTGNQLNLSASGGTAWSWSGPNSFATNTQNPSRSLVDASMSGAYSVTISSVSGCLEVATIQVTIGQTINPQLSSNSPLCTGAILQLSVTNVEAGAQYTWEASVPFSSVLQNPTRANATTAMSGVYKLTVRNNGCSATATMSVTVINQSTAQINPSTTQSICQGQALNLRASGGSPFSWSGPDNFSSTNAIASLNTSSTSYSGVYKVTVGSSVCTATATVSVQINANPIPNPSSNSSICTGETLRLFSNGEVSGYAWAANGYSSNEQNPTRPTATTAMSGTYTITQTNTFGCTASASINVVVHTAPNLVASSNSPLCEGKTLQLSASGGTNYSWEASGFTSSQQSPNRPNAMLSMSGIYKVTAINGSCSITSTATISVQVNPSFTVSVGFAPICLVGNPLNLSASGGDEYRWRGPNGFTSTSATPTKAKTVAKDEGVYSVTVTGNAVCTVTSTIRVYYGVGKLTATSNSPVCKGGTIQLSATAEFGNSYSWTKQLGSTTYTGQHPTIPNAKTSDGGLYMVFAKGMNGCIGKQEVLVTVSPVACIGTRMAREEVEEIDMQINAYPNPVTNTLTVEVTLKEPSKLSLSLFNSIGKESGTWLLNEEVTFHKTELNMSDLTGGVYLLQAQTNKHKIVKKVVKVQY